jgi:predicted nuclease with TOPRIM domain
VSSTTSSEPVQFHPSSDSSNQDSRSNTRKDKSNISLAIPIVEENEEHSDESSILHSNDFPLSDGNDVVLSRNDPIATSNPPPLPPRSNFNSKSNVSNDAGNVDAEKKSSLESVHAHEISALKEKISNEISKRDVQMQKFGEVMNKLEKFETLAKLQMKQMSQSAQNLSNLPRTSNLVPPLSADPSSPSSMFKEFESYKQEAQARLDQLEFLLKEERTKTSRFMVLKLENQELHEIIASKDQQIKTLNEGITSLNDQLSDLKRFVSGYESTVQTQKLEIDSLRSQSSRLPKDVTLEVGEPGYVMQVRRRVFDSKDELSSTKPSLGLKAASFSESLEGSRAKLDLDRLHLEHADLKEQLETSSMKALQLKQENERLQADLSQSKLRETETKSEKQALESTVCELNSRIDDMKTKLIANEETQAKNVSKAELEKIHEIIRNSFKLISASKGIEPEGYVTWKAEFQNFLDSLPKHSPSIHLLAEIFQHFMHSVEALMRSKGEDSELMSLEKRLQESELLLLKQWEDFNSEKNQLSIQIEQKDKEILELREFRKKAEEQQIIHDQIQDKQRVVEMECVELNDRLKSATLDIM